MYFCSLKKERGVAQLASVLAWGARGRKFESSHPDVLKKSDGFSSDFFLYFPQFEVLSEIDRLDVIVSSEFFSGACT